MWRFVVLVAARGSRCATWLTYSYDRYGNLSCTLNGQTEGPCAQYSYNGNNQVSSYTYDAAGELTSDGTRTYSYDAEGRLTSSTAGGNTSTWVYNALGQQVEKASTIPDTYQNERVFDPWGWLAAYWNTSESAWGLQRFRLGGRVFAYYNMDPDSTTMRFEHANHLGSTSMVTDESGDLESDDLFYPWGQAWEPSSGGADPNFAGLLGDDRWENLYPAANREYGMTYGRWLSERSADLVLKVCGFLSHR